MYTKNIKRGFTLLEILLVITTIGILSSIVLIAINPNRQINQAKQTVIISEKNSLEKGLQQFLIDTSSYPSGIDGLPKKICSNILNNDCLDITSTLTPTYISSIPSSSIYTVLRGADSRIYVNTVDTSINFKCPSGYIRVPGNSLYNTKDFCVMKYEAKAIDLNNPNTGLTSPSWPDAWARGIANNVLPTISLNGRGIASVPSGYPIVNIDHPTALSYCSSKGERLINNSEWMTIARNIESQSVNWISGVVGNGGLWRGHTDVSPAYMLEASTDDSNSYFQTNNTSPSPQKRTYVLSNGEVIWDFAGNAEELVSDIILGKDQPKSNLPGGAWISFSSLINYGLLNSDGYIPGNVNWMNNQNMGQIVLDSTVVDNQTYSINRGSVWYDPATLRGVYDTRLNRGINSTDISLGFRCVKNSL
jgi:prepilin-type N-terminal cleavage/methylation domain-containing protein